MHPSCGTTDHAECPYQRVRRTDLVVPIRSDQQKVTHLWMIHEMFDQVESSPIQPLQIVEEERERMFRLGEHTQESPEDLLETSLRFLRRQVGSRWLFTDDESKFRNEVHHERAIR